jgi:predicted enzyme related to lactoylglutathione lyase
MEAASEHGASIITAPHPEGNLRIAVITDPAGNFIGIWTG